MQSSPQLPMSSREGTPTGASPGKSWGGPEAARPSFWETQSLDTRPLNLPAAEPPSVSGASAEAVVDVPPGQGCRRAAKSLDHGVYTHERECWAAEYTGSDMHATARAVCGPSETMQDTVTGASICARLRQEQEREATRNSSERAGAASKPSRPALRDRTDSAVYHRANYDEVPLESTSRQEACVKPEPSGLQGPAREHSSDLVKGHSGGCSSGPAAGLGGIAEEPAQRGRERKRDPDAVAHVLRANLSSSEVQLSRRVRDMLESGPAPGSLLTQVRLRK